MGANESRAVGRKVCRCSGGAALRHGRRVVSGASVCLPPVNLPRYPMSLLTPPHPLTRRTCATTSSIPICASSLPTLSYSATFSCLQRIPSLTVMPVRVYNITITMSIQYAKTVYYNSSILSEGIIGAAICIYFLDYSFTSSKTSRRFCVQNLNKQLVLIEIFVKNIDRQRCITVHCQT